MGMKKVDISNGLKTVEYSFWELTRIFSRRFYLLSEVLPFENSHAPTINRLLTFVTLSFPIV